MTDAQLYTAIGVPVIGLLFAMVMNFALIARVDKRIDDLRIDKRLDDLNLRFDKRIDDLNLRIDKRFEDLKELFRAEMQRNHSEVMAKFAELEHRLERIKNERRVIQ